MFTYALVLTNPPIDEETGEPTQGLQKLVRDMKLISGNGQPPATSSDIKWLPVEYAAKPAYDDQTQTLREVSGRNETDDAWVFSYVVEDLPAAQKKAKVVAKYNAMKAGGFTFAGKQFDFKLIPEYNGAMIALANNLPIAPRSVKTMGGEVVTLATNDDIKAFYATGFAYYDELADLEHTELGGIS